jgi:hypothetical protein
MLGVAPERQQELSKSLLKKLEGLSDEELSFLTQMMVQRQAGRGQQ